MYLCLMYNYLIYWKFNMQNFYNDTSCIWLPSHVDFAFWLVAKTINQSLNGIQYILLLQLNFPSSFPYSDAEEAASPTSQLLMEYEEHLRNTLEKDSESFSLQTFEALLSRSMENLGISYKLFSEFIFSFSLYVDLKAKYIIV